jgi:hypothetical protein
MTNLESLLWSEILQNWNEFDELVFYPERRRQRLFDQTTIINQSSCRRYEYGSCSMEQRDQIELIPFFPTIDIYRY